MSAETNVVSPSGDAPAPNSKRVKIRSAADETTPMVAPWLSRTMRIPGLIFMLVLFLVPMIIFGVSSFYPGGLGRGDGVPGFDNYGRVLGTAFYLGSFWLSIWVSAVVTVAAIVLVFPVAYLIARTSAKWVTAVMILILAPQFVPTIIQDIGWVVSLGSQGPVNVALQALPFVDGPLQIMNTTLAVIIGKAHFVFPLLTFIMVGIIRRVDPSLEEAAASMGCPRWKIYFKVVIPILMPQLITTALMIFSLCIGIYTTAVLLGGGRVNTIPVVIAEDILTRVDYGLGATSALLLLIIVWVIAVLLTRIMRRQKWS